MKKTYRISMPMWAVPQQEEYFQKLALQGLFVEKIGAYLTRFVRGPKKKLVYRLEAAPSRGQPPEEEQRQFYESCGWNYVCQNGYFNVFSAQFPVNELHTDSTYQKETLAPIRKGLRKEWLGSLFGVAVILAINVFAFRLTSIRGDLTFLEGVVLLLMEVGPWIPMLLCLLLILTLVRSGVAASFFSHYIKAVGMGKALRPVKFKRMLNLRRIWMAVMGLLWIAILMWVISAYGNAPIPMGEEPDGQYLLHLEELDPGITVLQGEDQLGNESGKTKVNSSLFAPVQLYNYQYAEGEKLIWMRQNYLRKRDFFSSQCVAAAISKQKFLKEPQAFPADSLPGGIDSGFYGNWEKGAVELVLTSDDRILCIQYYGGAKTPDEVLQMAATVLIS